MKGFCDNCNNSFKSDYNLGIVWDNGWTIQMVTYGHPVYHGKLFCSMNCINAYMLKFNLKLRK